MRFAFVATEKACYPVGLMCRVLKVSRAGYYAWAKRPASQHTQEDQRLGLQVAAIYRESRGRYGSPRVHAELRERGQRTGRKRVARLMQTAGLRAREPVASAAPLIPGTAWRLSKICWTGGLQCPPPTGAGSRTLLMCGPRRVGCTWR